MHLINAKTKQLEARTSEIGIRYAILSHRWEDEEVEHQDMQDLNVARARKGFRKIENCCSLAMTREIYYIWIDTCCIDKKSSAELSEAINSMYRWYKNAAECYAYLSDVEDVGRDLASSEWFQRGWTLQELLAPKEVLFYGRNFTPLGTRKTLIDRISDITNIAKPALNGHNILTFSIAQRMSWASKRKTTRPEDRAYSLIGIFNVSMPMLYGEGGERAFMRLQEEIIKYSNDTSIFAWHGVPDEGSGLLARTLDCFSDSNSVRTGSALHESWSISNRGLEIELSLTVWCPNTYFARLKCGDKFDNALGIFVFNVDGEEFRRIKLVGTPDLLQDSWTRDAVQRRFQRRKTFFRHDILMSYLPLPIFLRREFYGMKLSIDILKGENVVHEILHNCVQSAGTWNAETQLAELSPGQIGDVATIDLNRFNLRIKRIKIGFGPNLQPRCVLLSSMGQEKPWKDYSLYGKPAWRINFLEREGWLENENHLLTQSRHMKRVYIADTTEDVDDEDGLWLIQLGDDSSVPRFRICAPQVICVVSFLCINGCWEVKFQFPRPFFRIRLNRKKPLGNLGTTR